MAVTQAKKLAEAICKLARMQSEVEQLQKACESHQDVGQIEASHRAQINNLRQEQNQHQEQHYQANSPFDPTSLLSPQLQLTPWPFGYKLTQLPKYNGSVDPTQFLMTYEATIASAGGDDPIMAKSFIMACEGPVATWYSYLPPLSITSRFHLRDRLKQDFQVFKKAAITSVEEFQCFQMDREPLPDYLRRFVQKKAQTPIFSENTTI